MENNFDVDLTEQNSLKLRSVAKNYIEFTKPDELKSIRNNYFLRSIKINVIGDGTNSIFPRKFNGLVLKHSGKKIEVTNKTKQLQSSRATFRVGPISSHKRSSSCFVARRD